MKSTKNRTHLHVHVTVTNFPKITPKGWKETTIQLINNGRFQTDKMLTRHFMIDNNEPFINKILSHVFFLPFKSYEIIRIKIEQESNFPNVIPDGNYLEIHAETADSDLPDGWVFSYNPHRKNVNFINRRFYSGNITKLLREVDETLVPYKAEYRPELIIYDSNHAHDSWWA